MGEKGLMKDHRSLRKGPYMVWAWLGMVGKDGHGLGMDGEGWAGFGHGLGMVV